MPHRTQRARRGLRAPLLLLATALSPVPCPLSPAFAAQTTLISAPADLDGAELERVRAAPFARGLLELAPGPDGALPASGAVTLAALPAPAFDSLVASWNAETPPGTSVEVWAQIHAFNEWSEWFPFGVWDADGGASAEKETATAWMDFDTLKLKAGDQKARAFRLRAVLRRGRARTGPVLQALAAATADHTGPLPPEPDFSPGPWVRELEVPPRSQMTEQAEFARDICSPTALSMALAYWGRPVAVGDAAVGVRDRRSGRFGVWPFNTAWAARHGLRAHAARLNRLADLQQEVAAGAPVVVSVGFAEGSLDGAPLTRTRGHLLVVRGFTAAGDLIVNDPAAPEAASVRRVYRREQFRAAWLENKRGLSYLMRPRLPAALAVARATQDLRTRPAPGDGAPLDRGRLSQLLAGEPVRALEVAGAWVRVEAPEQLHAADGAFAAYGGWVEAAALGTPSPAFQPDSVVIATAAAAIWEGPDGPRRRELPLGARVMRLRGTGAPLAGEGEGRTAVRLFDGVQASLEVGALQDLPLAGPARRKAVLRAAELLLGRRYVWGGRSSIHSDPSWGVDCSGLASLAHRAAGVLTPRDAHDQFLKAAPLDRAARPGDLFFLSRPGSPREINHVGIYAGGDELIEAVEDGGVRRTTFTARLGGPLAGLKAGAAVGGRTLWFGTFLND